MKTRKFYTASITTGTYKCRDYNYKNYNTNHGFIKGLKANKCPFTYNKTGCYFELDGGLDKVQWNYYGKKYTATIYAE